MGKLTIGQKAQRYDEAIEQLRTMMPNWENLSYSGKTFLQDLVHILPELKESKESGDEKIRKELIDYFKENNAALAFKGISNECVLAWLEKQGEHANFRNKIQIGDKVTRNEDGVLVNLSQLNRVAKKDEKQGETFTKKDVDDAYLKGVCDAKHELEKQDGQNTVVVIPKFRVGDVIRPKGSTAEYTIESISGECYHGKGWGLHISCDNDYELVEQKPADLKTKAGNWYVCDMEVMNENMVTAFRRGEIYHCPKDGYLDVHGALFEVGCLDVFRLATEKEIPQTKQEWSEEDKSLCSQIQGILNVCKSHSLLSPDLYKEMCNWLKSLKERYTWKPSEEQMKALQESIGIVGELTIKGEYLKELFEDLKKLREG